LRAWFLLVLMGAGPWSCVTGPKLTAEHAAACVPLTFAFQNVVRDAGPVRVELDDGDPEFIELHLVGPAGRAGFFRVWRGDRRIEMWDWKQQAWVGAGVCD
jgi:hypothetical protein